MDTILIHGEGDHGGGKDTREVRPESLIKAPPAFEPAEENQREGSGQKGVLAILDYLTGDVHGTNVILLIVGHGNYKESFIQRSLLHSIVTKDIPSSSSTSSLETFSRCSL